MPTINTKIKNRIDSKANWDAATGVPLAGEILIYNTTPPRIKVGNGTNKPSALKYVNSDAIVSITRSGTTFTATKVDGTTTTFTQQDNNTTYSAGTGLSLSGTTFSIASSVLTTSNYTSYVPTKTGSGASGTWNINITGSSASCTGNAATATALSSEISVSRLPIRLRENTSGTSANPNTFMSSGFYYTDSSGIPNVGDANILTIAHTKNSWCHQLGFKFSGSGVTGNAYDGADVYTRIYNSTNNAWSNWHALLSSGNYTSYTVTKTGDGASGTWGINISGNANTANYLNIIASNEIRFNNLEYSSLWFHYCKSNGAFATEKCLYYNFGNGQGSSEGVTLNASYFSGTAAKLGRNGNTATPMTFNWSGQEGQPSWLWGGTDGTNMYVYNPSNFSVNYANSSASSNWLNVNATCQYGLSGLNYFNASLGTTASATSNYGPTADWYHIIRMNHANSQGYYVDLAACFHSDNLYIKRVSAGTNYGYKHVWVEGNSITGAVWNDYAECRESHCTESGRVVQEVGDDTLTITTERLAHFTGIVSDTWGFSQGETERAKTPIAVAGRVLVYTYEDRDTYQPGDCVCAAPNGTVSKMTREEIINYPDRIVGKVSCVPTYERWGDPNDDRGDVAVDGRIWVIVK